MENDLKSNNNILEINNFVITSLNEIISCINHVKRLKNKNVVVHVIYFSKTQKLLQNLQDELCSTLPDAKIVLLEDNNQEKIYLTFYTLQNITNIQDANNEILTKLYNDNKDKDSNIKNYRNKLFSRYFIDHLTNLPNIYQLRKDLEMNEEFSLIIFNIDNFQIINNFYGLIVGDYVIEEIGRYLKENITDHNIYRLSGNEFAFVINKNMFFYDIKEHLNGLYLQLKNIVIKYQKINIFIDITLASSAAKDKTKIFSKVSMALKYAKELNIPFWIYEDKMQFETNYEKNIQLSEVIREAVNNSKIIPYYQAIIDTKTLKIKKYECLARLIDSDGKIIPPLEFIPISKTIKRYCIITKSIINKSFETFENTDVNFTINLAIEDIVSREMFEFIMDKLKNSKASHLVTFEILESDAIEDFTKVKKFIQEVKRYGAEIAIDDFGDGYSNFSYITKMDVDYIKIDGSLIKNIDKDENSYLVVESIVDFAKKLGIKTIAEFVHSSEVMEKIKYLEIDYAQGYFISKPSLLTSQ